MRVDANCVAYKLYNKRWYTDIAYQGSIAETTRHHELIFIHVCCY